MAEKTFKLKKKKKKKPGKTREKAPHRAAYNGESQEEPRCPENNPICRCLYPSFEK